MNGPNDRNRENRGLILKGRQIVRKVQQGGQNLLKDF